MTDQQTDCVRQSTDINVQAPTRWQQTQHMTSYAFKPLNRGRCHNHNQRLAADPDYNGDRTPTAADTPCCRASKSGSKAKGVPVDRRTDSHLVLRSWRTRQINSTRRRHRLQPLIDRSSEHLPQSSLADDQHTNRPPQHAPSHSSQTQRNYETRLKLNQRPTAGQLQYKCTVKFLNNINKKYR